MASSSVDSLGTVRNVLRGLDDVSFAGVIYEAIDDREHSKPTKSEKVFLDFRPESRTFVVGYENSASREDIDRMVRWNPTNEKHAQSKMATAGQGLRFLESTFKGKNRHISVDTTDPSVYYESELSSKAIGDIAFDPTMSEAKFQQVLDRETVLARERSSDELIHSVLNVFENPTKEYPFKPKTIIYINKIENDKIIRDLDNCEFVDQLKHRLLTKYFDELKTTAFELFVRFPKSEEFISLKSEVTNGKAFDVIGSTVKEDETSLVINILSVKETHSVSIGANSKNTKTTTLQGGTFVFMINDLYFCLIQNGKAYSRVQFTPKVDDKGKTNLQSMYKITQYKLSDSVSDKQLKEMIVGSSAEAYAGIYVRFGDTFVNDQPAPGGGLARSQPGARRYRAIFELCSDDVSVAKSKLQINGLKHKFDIKKMPQLEQAILQCQTIFKNFDDDPSQSPLSYVPSTKGSNKVNTKTNDSGWWYLLKVGNNFYKQGISTDTEKDKRMLSYYQKDDTDTLRTDFPTETIVDTNDRVFLLLKPSDHVSIDEKWLADRLLNMEGITTYKNKSGNGIREYFHATPETLQEVIDMMTAHKYVE